MSRRLPLLLGLMVAFGVGAGCEEGPEGPAGPQGPQGPPGPPGGLICADCHDASSALAAIQQQFMLSPHGFDQFELRGPDYAGGNCVACHSHQGFVAAVTGTEADWSAGVAAPSCRTCHRIHTGDGFALMTTDPVTLRVTGETVDLAGEQGPGGNLCAECHQARQRDWPDLAQDTFEISSTHYGVHYGPQANVFTGMLAEAFEFGVSETGAFGPHAELSCSGCHMGLSVDELVLRPVAGGELHHTFAVSQDVCATCHILPDQTAGGFEFDHEGIQTQVSALLADLGECLEAEGVIEITAEMAALRMGGEVAALHGGDIGDLEYEPVVGRHPSGFVAAYLAFNALVEDGSMGVHQPDYARSLAAAALDYMEANSDLCPVPDPPVE